MERRCATSFGDKRVEEVRLRRWPACRQEDVRSGNDRVALHGGSPHLVPIRGLIGNAWRDDAMAGNCDGWHANRMGNEGANRFLLQCGRPPGRRKWTGQALPDDARPCFASERTVLVR